ncbi:lipoprotein [Tatumella sp. JGM118]|uniref:LPS-assembly lipoprotein LptM n=1 Tax=Tatumella terrea TaxID=419007 RepID=A0ABW1VTM2_9GAMM|nr:lipoprotein [Tatumella sp. JGM118]
MKKMFGWLLVIVIPAVLTGCGLKGPLYFPKDQARHHKTTTVVPQDTDTSVPAGTVAP